jgi:ribose transport system ATP-binding protein
VEIYRLMQKLAADGAAVIMVSSELPEILNMSDRIEVVFGGRIVKEFLREEADSESVMEYALGLHAGTHGAKPAPATTGANQ